MNRVNRKPDFLAHAKTKAQISFAGTEQLISAFIFITWIVWYNFSSTYFQNFKLLAFHCDYTGAKIKIIFVTPYPNDPKKLPLPKKFYCNFSCKIIFFYYC